MPDYVFPPGDVVWPAEAIIALQCQPGYMSPDDWRPVTGCAVVLAESGGNPLALGKVVWKPDSPIHLTIDSLGMFQLLLYYHCVTGPYPDVPPISVADCFDPFKAWEQTWRVINKERTGWQYNWNPWSTFRSPDGVKPPAYDRHVSAAYAGMRSYRQVMDLGPGVFG